MAQNVMYEVLIFAMHLNIGKFGSKYIGIPMHFVHHLSQKKRRKFSLERSSLFLHKGKFKLISKFLKKISN